MKEMKRMVFFRVLGQERKERINVNFTNIPLKYIIYNERLGTFVMLIVLVIF